MSSATAASRPPTIATDGIPEPAGAAAVVLVRALAAGEGGITRATLLRDLQPLTAHKLAPAEWRAALDGHLAALIESGQLRPLGRGRVAVTQEGQRAAWRFLQVKLVRAPTWPELKNGPLVARALGASAPTSARLRPLEKAHGLRAAIIDSRFSLKLRSVPAPARLRDALARRALREGRAKAPAGRSDAETSRTIAAQLLSRPREVGTDTELISLIAAEQAGSVQSDMAALRLQLLRDLMFEQAEGLAPPPRPAPISLKAKVKPPRAPPLEQFARSVRGIAGEVAQGWSGNRRAYICHVWRAWSARNPGSELTESGFKSMLSEAHRAGHLQLTNADLKDRRSLADIQASAVAYMNSVLHFIRVEDR